MARIRTIKPEFPQSESMGRVSRDARLTFIMLWTLADDSGRLRGNSRMLASLLFPYDSDAFERIDGWLSELDSEGCIGRYKVGSDAYIEILNWLTHQKIDKPSQSKIPAFDESSRILANPRESSSEDQGSRKGPGDQGKDHDKPPSKRKACLSKEDLVWFEKAWDRWPSVNVKDGSAAPTSPKHETMKRFEKILKTDSIPAEVLAYACGIYCLDREKDGIYLKSMETFLGPKRCWADYLERAKAATAKQHVQQVSA